MPRRSVPDALSLAIGKRIRALRLEAGLTLEKLAYESELGSKGHLSDVEKGLVRPTAQTLHVLADRLGVALTDLVNFPDSDTRSELIERTRYLDERTLRALLTSSNVVPPSSNAPRTRSVRANKAPTSRRAR